MDLNVNRVLIYRNTRDIILSFVIIVYFIFLILIDCLELKLFYFNENFIALKCQISKLE